MDIVSQVFTHLLNYLFTCLSLHLLFAYLQDQLFYGFKDHMREREGEIESIVMKLDLVS